MIKEHSYHGKLYGKKTVTFEFETLEELRELKERYPSVTIYKFKDCCLSFRSLSSIKKELKGKTIKLQSGETLALFDYYKKKPDAIEKLANSYIFKSSDLRGYGNTFYIEWQTKTQIVTAETKNFLWTNTARFEETDTNHYAEHTVRAVKLVPLRNAKLGINYSFNYIHWSGGDISTINTLNDPDSIREFELELFYNEKRF